MKRVLLKKDYYFILATMWAAPVLTFAQANKGIKGIFTLIGDLIASLIPLVIALGVLYFLWGVLSYIKASDADKQSEARMTMLNGIIVLFVMVSIWGLVAILGDTLNLSNEVPNVPGIPGFKNY